MKLLGNRLLVKIVRGLKSEGGIFFPPSAMDSARFGGPKLYDVLQPGSKAAEVLAGDRVLCFSWTDGAQPLDDGTAIVSMDQVLAIIPKDKRYEGPTP